ncbi:hypothetical protein MUK42_34042, partial [Musa troglodytarum]
MLSLLEAWRRTKPRLKELETVRPEPSLLSENLRRKTSEESPVRGHRHHRLTWRRQIHESCFLRITGMFKSSLVVDCIFSNIVEEFSGTSKRLESMFS